MSMLINILISIPVILLLLLVIGIFSRKGYGIERAITIQRPVDDVFHYLKFQKNQDRYNKWVMVDPAMTKAYHGSDGEVGFVYSWDGNSKAGAGEMEIASIEPGKRIEVDIRFIRPFKGAAQSLMETKPVIDPQNIHASTTLVWKFSSRLKYPMNVMLLFVNIEKKLANDLGSSLANLKTILEK